MSIDHSAEIYDLQLRLVWGNAENARLDGEELRAAGFEPVRVIGLDSALWKMEGGAQDGGLYTTQAALAEIGREDQKEDS